MSINPVPYGQDPAQYINGGMPVLAAASFTAGQNGADTTEDTLQTFSLPAGFLLASKVTGNLIPPQPAKVLKLRAWGVTANNADSKTLRLYHGTTVFSATLTASSAAAWEAELELMASGVATQIARFRCLHGTAIIATSQLTNGADSLASALVAKVTGQAGAANAGDIVCNGAVVEFWS